MASLFLVASGVDAALDRLSHSVAQNSFTVYSERGSVVLAYEGDLSACKAYGKPCPSVTPTFLHRT
jgi:hypothetical protein